MKVSHLFVTSAVLLSSACAIAGLAPKKSAAPASPAAAAGGAEDQLSPADVTAILQLANDEKDASCTNCVYPGVDFTAKTVEVQDTDLAIRNEWVARVVGTSDYKGSMMSGVDLPNEDVRDKVKQVAKDCGIEPWPIKVDVAVVKIWRINKLAEPLGQAVLSMDCRGAHAAFMKKVKRFHVRLTTPYPLRKDAGQLHGYTYAFDKKTGELAVGVDTYAGNISQFAAQFLDQQ